MVAEVVEVPVSLLEVVVLLAAAVLLVASVVAEVVRVVVLLLAVAVDSHEEDLEVVETFVEDSGAAVKTLFTKY